MSALVAGSRICSAHSTGSKRINTQFIIAVCAATAAADTRSPRATAQQAGIGAGDGDAGPVVGQGDDLLGLFDFGDAGVGVDHLGGGVVLGEEGEHAGVR